MRGVLTGVVALGTGGFEPEISWAAQDRAQQRSIGP